MTCDVIWIRGEKFLGKFSKKPLAVFVSWGIFLPVDGNEPNDADRRFAFERKSQGENENKNFSKKLLTKTKTALN